MAEVDPITRVYGALRDALESDLKTIGLKVGNWLDDTTDGQTRKVVKGAGAPNDFFNAALHQSTFTQQPFGKNSMSVNFSQRFVLMVETGLLKIVKMNQIKWQVIKTMKRVGPELGLSGLVLYCTLDSATDRDKQAGSQLNGFSATFTFNVEMYQAKAYV